MPANFSHVPDLTRRAFARTNAQTIAQRIGLIKELLPNTEAIAEICCGDCSRQWQAYQEQLGIGRYRGLDIEPTIVSYNKAQGIDCLCGNALNPDIISQFLDFDLIFYGPPLSVACDAHRLLAFSEVVPSFFDFTYLLLGELGFSGTLVCIAPKTTTMGEIQHLYQHVKSFSPDYNLPLIHYSYANTTGQGEATELRLKYIELWFSNQLGDDWQVRESLSSLLGST